MLEFTRAMVEPLRQPLESGCVTVARADAHASYPAGFQLIATMNPWPPWTRSSGTTPGFGIGYPHSP